MMKPEHKDLSPTELALLTWYKPDNSLYRNPEHPTIKLAGEIGELLDLYGKHKYKPGFDWMQCKHWKDSLENHFEGGECDFEKCFIMNSHYTPLVLDELGDIYYYLRILAWIYDLGLLPSSLNATTGYSIKIMYHHADNILNGGNHENRNFEVMYRIQSIYDCLLELLKHLDTTIEDLTLLNYYKLNSEETAHGWKDAQ